MIGSCQIETGTPGLERQDHERHIIFSVKLLHQLLAGLYMYTAVNDQALTAENLLQIALEVRNDLLILRKDQYSLSLFIDGFAESPQNFKLPAVLWQVTLLSHILIGMVADLLQLCDRCQHNTAPLHSVHFGQSIFQFFHQFPIQNDLLLGQGDVLRLFNLVRKIGDDFLIALQSS